MGDSGQLEQRLHVELTAALRSRDREVASAMRSALGRLANAQAVPIPEPVPDPHAASTLDFVPNAAGDSVNVAGATAGLAATERPRRELGAAEGSGLVRAERTELLAHAQRLRELCRWDEAAGVRRAAEVLGRVLDGQ